MVKYSCSFKRRRNLWHNSISEIISGDSNVAKFVVDESVA